MRDAALITVGTGRRGRVRLGWDGTRGRRETRKQIFGDRPLTTLTPAPLHHVRRLEPPRPSRRGASCRRSRKCRRIAPRRARSPCPFAGPSTPTAAARSVALIVSYQLSALKLRHQRPPSGFRRRQRPAVLPGPSCRYGRAGTGFADSPAHTGRRASPGQCGRNRGDRPWRTRCSGSRPDGRPAGAPAPIGGRSGRHGSGSYALVYTVRIKH